MFDLYTWVRPLLHRLDPERAHELTLRALELGLVPSHTVVQDPILQTSFLGRQLAHPLGMAAGFDKNARVIPGIFRLGFAWAEVGGVTPLPQQGNPRPRVFRLSADEAVINRMGFPNDGADRVLERLQSQPTTEFLGINIASNAESPDPIADFVILARRFAPHVRFITLDISCPNTANGQVFLEPQRLRALLQALASEVQNSTPGFIAKVSPDLADQALERILTVLEEERIAAICMGNTTISRPARLLTKSGERGGLSGRPLFELATEKLRFVRKCVGNRIPLIGTGGIASGADAYAKIRAGATTLQIYTGLIYQGPALINRILVELAAAVHQAGYSRIAEAVGADVDV